MARKLRRTVATLKAEAGRLEDRIDALYHQQSAIPAPSDDIIDDHGLEAFWEAEARYDSRYEDYSYRIGRIVARLDTMYDTIFDIELRLWWEFDYQA